MSRRYLVNSKAAEDLDDQAFYYGVNASPEVANRYLVAADHTFGLLASQPEIGWRARIRSSELKGVRIFPVAGFSRMLILYRPDAAGVEILRVVHSSRNLRALLKREGLH